MNENILVINIHSSRNLGDAALLQVTLQQLRANFTVCNITLSIDDPTSHKGNERVIESIITWVHQVNSDGNIKWNFSHLVRLLPASLLPIWSQRFFGKAIYALTPKTLKPIIQAYLDADMVVSEPGGFLYSSGRGISLLITVYSIALAIFANKPVYMLPQSIGPLKHPWEGKIIRWMLDHVRMVMIRETISLGLVQAIGVERSRVRLVPDLAFAIPMADQSIGKDWLLDNGLDPQNDGPLLGMTIINWGAQHKGFELQSEYEKACAASASWFIKNTGGKVILFPQVWGPYPSQDDRIPARRVADQLLELSGSIYQVEQPLSIELLKAVYSWMDIFIGTRMHSNIFALSEGVPVIAIGYLHKTRGIADMIGIGEWVVDIHQVVGNELIIRLKALWTDHQYWRMHILNTVPGLVQEATQVGGWVKEDYDNWVQENI